MKRLILRSTVALITFTLGFAVQQVAISRQRASSQAQKVEPVILKAVPACPAATPSPLPTPTPTPPPQLVFDYNTAAFNPRVVYLPIGRQPAELRQVDSFEISVDLYNGRPQGYIELQTLINGQYDSQIATFALITEERLFFITHSAVDGAYEYRFEGEFIRDNPIYWADKNVPVVRGTLTMTRNGFKIYEHVITFKAEYLGC